LHERDRERGQQRAGAKIKDENLFHDISSGSESVRFQRLNAKQAASVRFVTRRKPEEKAMNEGERKMRREFDDLLGNPKNNVSLLKSI
jgi:hypothetical protein